LKNIIVLVLCLFFASSTTLPQKRIIWGEDPVNLTYDGSVGMIPIKLLYNTKAITTGGSGKKTIGSTGKGLVVYIDSVDFFTPGKKIDNGVVQLCGNPTQFPDGIDRGKIIVLKRTIVNKNEFTCDLELQKISEGLGLLSEEISNISKNVWQLNKKVSNIEELLSKSEEKTHWWESNWVIAGVAGAIFAVLIKAALSLHHHDQPVAIVIPTTKDTGWDGVTGGNGP